MVAPQLQLHFQFELLRPTRQLCQLFPDVFAEWEGRTILSKVRTRAFHGS